MFVKALDRREIHTHLSTPALNLRHRKQPRIRSAESNTVSRHRLTATVMDALLDRETHGADLSSFMWTSGIWLQQYCVCVQG